MLSASLGSDGSGAPRCRRLAATRLCAVRRGRRCGRRRAASRQAEQLGKIEGAAQHLLSALYDILGLSKIEAAKLHLEERDFGLRSLLLQVAPWTASWPRG